MNHHVQDSGLHINPSFPHLGASPDGIVQFECCGNGVLEIKCPYNAREHSISDAVLEGIIDFLDITPHGNIALKQSHQYYYQIQAQIAICAARYADLVVWTTQDCLVTRIIPSHNFFIEVVQKVNEMYCSIILPQLLGKWWSKQNITIEDIPTCSSQLGTQDPSCWCYCGLDDDQVDSDLIGCDNQLCQVKWFHTACLQLDIIPRGKWYCPDCKSQFKSTKRSKK